MIYDIYEQQKALSYTHKKEREKERKERNKERKDNKW
jgi:hypothetical protein